MFKTFKHIKQALKFMQLPKRRRRVVFYSEGKSYWPLFKGLIDGVLEKSELNICYITSGKNDPGIKYNHSNYGNKEILHKTYIIETVNLHI